MNYWGPLANHKSSDWIVDATCAVLEMRDLAPDLLLTYIPHLDYDLQRHGPDGAPAQKALDLLLGYLTRIKTACAEMATIGCSSAIMRSSRWGAALSFRIARYAKRGSSPYERFARWPTRIFSPAARSRCGSSGGARYCRDAESTAAARATLEQAAGSRGSARSAGSELRGLDHPRTGELVIVAEAGAWFAYPWFEKGGGAGLREPRRYPQQAGL
jgi:hypothetical protein